MKTYSAQEFYDELSNEVTATRTRGGPSVIGWTRKFKDPDKVIENEAPTLMFSTDSVNWIPIPLDMIESIEPLQDSSGSAIFVRVNFTPPENAQAIIFAQLVEMVTAFEVEDSARLDEPETQALAGAQILGFRWKPPKIKLPRLPHPTAWGLSPVSCLPF